MGKVGKFLGPVVVILALAAAVLSFLIANQRARFRDRAAVLAQGITETSKALDEGSNSGLSGGVSFTPASPSSPRESGTLGWEDYKKSAISQDGSYKKTISVLPLLANKVIEQRNALTTSLLDTSKILGYPSEAEPSSADLNSLDHYADRSARLVDHARAVADRDTAILQKINEVAAVVNANVDHSLLNRPVFTDGEGIYQPGDYKIADAFVDFKTKVEVVLNRNQLLSAGVVGAMATINKHPWSDDLRPQSLARADVNTLRSQLALMAEDCKKINDSLIHYETMKGEYDKQKAVIGELEEKLTNLESENEEQQARLRKLEERIGFVDADPGQKVESWDGIDQDAIGKVMRVNKDYGFVVVDLSDKKVMRDVHLAVTRSGKYIATLAVIKAMPYQSIADLTHGNIANINIGDEIIISAPQTQPEPLLRGVISRSDDDDEESSSTSQEESAPAPAGGTADYPDF